MLQGGCLRFIADGASQPTLTDLYDTVFAVPSPALAARGGGSSSGFPVQAPPTVAATSPADGGTPASTGSGR